MSTDVPISQVEVVPITRDEPFGLAPVEFTHSGSLITATDAYAPKLLIRRCRECGQGVLRLCFARYSVWAETHADGRPWIRIGMQFQDFMRFTGCDVLHSCTQGTNFEATE